MTQSEVERQKRIARPQRINRPLWHYTDTKGSAGIIADGRILAFALGEHPDDKAMVWLSFNQIVEPTASAIQLNSFGLLVAGKAHRFEYVGPRPRRHYSVCDLLVAAGLDYTAKRYYTGANPEDWRVVTRDIPIDQIGRHEVWDGKAWVAAPKSSTKE